jgi:hypothetical protein
LSLIGDALPGCSTRRPAAQAAHALQVLDARALFSIGTAIAVFWVNGVFHRRSPPIAACLSSLASLSAAPPNALLS